jgi:two-component system KDP operon response regulator KdpE/two-component system response regulator VicR
MNHDHFQILAVDDEPRYLRVLHRCLETAGYGVQMARSAKDALEQIAVSKPDIVLMDVKMPTMTGFDACRQIREFSTVPIILITALNSTQDRIYGLECGADDFVTKPYNYEELLARIKAILRRTGKIPEKPQKSVFQLENLIVDFIQQSVIVNGKEIALTPTEYHLLVEMIQHPNRVLVPDYLLEKVWGEGYAGDTGLVWQAIHRLRRKIEPDHLHPRYIRTKPGIGYIFVIPNDPKAPTTVQ